MKKNRSYEQALSQLRDVDRRIKCLTACFQVISEPALIDSVNYELLALKARRLSAMEDIKRQYAAQTVPEK